MAVSNSKAVVGVFSYVDDLVPVIEAAKEAKRDYRVYAPTIVHEIQDVTSPKKSPVRYFTAVGAVTGMTAGFALAVWTALDWPLRVSAKEIVGIPSFIVVGYEWTILFGALMTLVGIFVLCKLPDMLRKVGFDYRFCDDKFGIVIGCTANEVEKVSRLLTESGAEEVHVKDAL